MTNSISGRAQSNALLTPRLKINEKCQSKDFQYWLQSRLTYKPGDNILDLCCGDGAQSVPISKRIGSSGYLTSVDINTESLESLKEKIGSKNNVSVISSDMMETSNYIGKGNNCLEYDLIHCSFALPYAKDPLFLLEKLYSHLKPNGTISISLPCDPHGMVKFCAKYYKIPDTVIKAITLGEKYIISHMRKSFGEVDISYFQSKLKFTSVKDFLEIYRCTTYFSAEAENLVSDEVEKIINNYSFIEFYKCAILISGKDVNHGGVEF